MPAAAARRLVLLLALAVPGGLAAQTPLSLREALARAGQQGYANRMAAGEHAARSGTALAPYRGILPTVRMEGGYLETTDPLSAFGFTLRRRAVTPAAFAPDRLNRPASTAILTTGLVVEQPLFNADAWLGRKAAARGARASARAEEWTRAGTAVDVVRGYWGAVLAVRQVAALRTALDAARAHVRQAESMGRQGLVTRSDVLLASVKSDEVEAMLLSAESGARQARQRLALVMGDPADSLFTLPGELPSSEQLAAAARTSQDPDAKPRADVSAAQSAREAAEADARRATTLYLPRLNGFGRLDWSSADTPFGGQSAWTVGLMLSWTPFAGASELAEIRAARGRSVSAQAMAEAAAANAGLEAFRTGDELTVALARLSLAARGVTQAAEAHRIVGRKYEGGLATVTELFDAAAVETASVLGDAAARYEVIVSVAEMRKARGLDLSPLLDLENRVE
jgi:outer membrane protein TolC